MRYRAATLCALVAVALAGCSGQPGTSATGSTTLETGSAAATSAPSTAQPTVPEAASVDTTSADAVAEAVAVGSLTYDTSAQSSPYDSIRAMSALMTPELAAQYPELGEGANPSTDATWAQARDIGAYNIPRVYTAQPPHGQPADTPTEVYRYYEASWTWYGTGGKTINDGRTHALYLTVALQDDDTWLVSTYDAATLS